jgi:hypothetical protein
MSVEHYRYAEYICLHLQGRSRFGNAGGMCQLFTFAIFLASLCVTVYLYLSCWTETKPELVANVCARVSLKK